MESRTTQLRRLLAALEAELRVLDYWSAQAPPERALQNPQPFCYDTLLLQEWLQWLFIPRLRQRLDARQTLPSNCNVHAYATEALKGVDEDTSRLLQIIAAIDRLLGEQPRLH